MFVGVDEFQMRHSELSSMFLCVSYGEALLVDVRRSMDWTVTDRSQGFPLRSSGVP